VTRPEIHPQDEHNRALLDHVHPAGWVNPEPRGRYNLVVVGAGTAGLVSAVVAAGLGARVALVERALMGGDCLNLGCVPSKSVIRASRLVAEARRAAELGLPAPRDPEIDFGAAMERMRRIRARIAREDSARRFSGELGVEVYLGSARFLDGESVEVEGRRLRFRRAVIATGARAAAPLIEGLAAAGYLTNETVFELTARPRRLGVIGAGPIGCELAQAFRRLGCEVALLDAAPKVLPREDADAAELVEACFRREGIRLLLGATSHIGKAVFGVMPNRKDIVVAGEDGDLPCLEVSAINFHDRQHDEQRLPVLLDFGTLVAVTGVLYCEFMQSKFFLQDVQLTGVGVPHRDPHKAIRSEDVIADVAERNIRQLHPTLICDAVDEHARYFN